MTDTEIVLDRDEYLFHTEVDPAARKKGIVSHADKTDDIKEYP